MGRKIIAVDFDGTLCINPVEVKVDDKHIFNKETDSEMLATDIVTFLQKWGIWQDVQIFTGGKCYTDDRGKVAIRNEKHPEKHLVGPTERDCNGGIIWKEFSNPERLLAKYGLWYELGFSWSLTAYRRKWRN